MVNIFEFLAIGKFIIAGLAVLGLIIIIIGAYKGSREQIVGGLFTIAAAVVIWLCGYIMVSQTKDRMQNYIEYKMEEEYNY